MINSILNLPIPGAEPFNDEQRSLFSGLLSLRDEGKPWFPKEAANWTPNVPFDNWDGILLNESDNVQKLSLTFFSTPEANTAFKEMN